MNEPTGRVVTFYSYKGGVGRTFAMANVALVLASWGQRVLCVDWDLDAPGLVHYFRPFVRGRVERGLLELIECVGAGKEVDWTRYVTGLDVDLPDQRVSIDLIAAGEEADTYGRRAQELAWPQLYEQRSLGLFLESVRSDWITKYDTVLIDSRTGITDIGAICTAQLPDIVVLGFTANSQSLGGAIQVIGKAKEARNRMPYDRPGLLTLPMPCRFDSREEYKQASFWRDEFRTRLAPLYAAWVPEGLDPSSILEHTTVPYFSYWSFGEQLAVLIERTSNPDLVSYYFETIAALLTHDLDRAEVLLESREQYVQAARRSGVTPDLPYDVYLSFTREYDALAAAITAALEGHGIRVAKESDVDSGSDWRSQIGLYTDQSRFLVPLIGTESAKSRWQQAEIRSFITASTDPSSPRTVIPVVVDQSALDALPSIVRSLQWIDGTSSAGQIAADLIRATEAITGSS